MKTLLVALGVCLGAAACTAQQTMPGMDMGAPPPARPKSAPRRADTLPAGERQPTQSAPAAPNDAPSITVPIQGLQEPEAIGFHTGSDLPAPELLGDVVGLPAMTLEEFLRLADRSNPTLAQAQRSVQRSMQQARQAGLPPDPVVGYSGDHIRGGSYHGGEQGAFVSQEFVLGGKLGLRREIARAEGRANELGVELQRTRVQADVTRAFYDALTAQMAVVLRDRLMKAAADAQTNAHELERVGQADASDVLMAEVESEQAKVEFVAAQRMFLGCFAQLAAFAGQMALTAHPLAGDLAGPPGLDPAAMVQAGMQDSPAVKQAQASVAVAEARVRSARREAVPNLSLKAGEWSSGEQLGSSGQHAGAMSFVEAGVRLPLWNRNQGNVEAARIELEQARQEVARTQLVLRNRAAPYAQQYETARFTAERYRTQILPRARRAYELEATKYRQMALAYPAVLRAQRMLFTLQLSYLHALNQQWQAAIALQHHTLENGLDQPPGAGSAGSGTNLPGGGSD